MIEVHVGTACNLHIKRDSWKERDEAPPRSTTETILILRGRIFMNLVAMYGKTPRIACAMLPEE